MQAERLKEDGRDASVIAPELTVEAGDTLHVPLPLAHLSHFAFRPMAPSGWDGSLTLALTLAPAPNLTSSLTLTLTPTLTLTRLGWLAR